MSLTLKCCLIVVPNIIWTFSKQCTFIFLNLCYVNRSFKHMTFTLGLKITNSSTYHQQDYFYKRRFSDVLPPSSGTDLGMAIEHDLNRQMNAAHTEDNHILHLNTKVNHSKSHTYTAPDIEHLQQHWAPTTTDIEHLQQLTLSTYNNWPQTVTYRNITLNRTICYSVQCLCPCSA